MSDAWIAVVPSFGQLTTIALASAIVATTSYVAYSLHLHPLARFPGPLLGRLTQWYDAYHAYKGDKHINFHRLHQKYGVVVRFSPNSLSINDPAALKAIYSHGSNVKKSTFYECFRATPHAVSTLLATDVHQHSRKRRIVGQAFSEAALKHFEQYILNHVRDFVDRVGLAANVSDRLDDRQAYRGQAIDMALWCNWLVFDIMGDLVFGRSFGAMGERAQNREGIRLLGRAARRNYVVGAMPILMTSGLEKYLPPLRQLFLDRCNYLAFGREQVNERTALSKPGNSNAMNSTRRDIFSFLLRAKDPESDQGMTMQELWMEGNTLIVAGSDTTAT